MERKEKVRGVLFYGNGEDVGELLISGLLRLSETENEKRKEREMDLLAGGKLVWDLHMRKERSQTDAWSRLYESIK